MLTIKEIYKKVSWSSISSGIFIILQSLLFLYLAHYLNPEILGAFSLSLSIVLFFTSILENGLPNSIINTDKPDAKDYNAVFSINLLLATLSTLLIILAVFTLNNFIPEINFSQYTFALLPTIFLAVYNKTQLVGLQKALKFKQIAQIEITSNVTYLISIIICTFLKLGIWILIISYLIKIASSTVILILKSYRFNDQFLQFIPEKVKQHWTFGKYIASEKVLSSIITYADTFIISFVLGLGTLGIYDVLKRIVIRPLVLLYNGAEQVFFPLFAKYKNDNNAFISSHNDLNFISKYFFISITCLLYVNWFHIMTLLPDSYQTFSTSFKMLCLFAATIVIVNPIDIILYSQGRSKGFFYWILSYTLPLLLVVYFSSQYGLSQLILSLSLFYVLLYFISYFILIKKTAIGFVQYFNVLFFACIYHLFIWGIETVFGLDTMSSFILSVIIISISAKQFYRKF